MHTKRIIRSLSTYAKRRLEQLSHCRTDEALRQRAQSVLLNARAVSACAIAARYQKHPNTVRGWFHRVVTAGLRGVFRTSSPGAPRRVTAEEEHLILRVARRAPSQQGEPRTCWSLRSLATYLKKRHRLRIHYTHLRRVLKKKGWPFAIVAPTSGVGTPNGCRNSGALLAWWRGLRRTVSSSFAMRKGRSRSQPLPAIAGHPAAPCG